MKIAIIVKSLVPSRGGGETYTLNLIRELVARWHEVHVFANVFAPIGVPVTFHKVEASAKLKWLRDLVFAHNSRHLLEGQDFDVIFGTGKATYVHVYRPGGGVHEAYITQDIASALTRPGRLVRRVAKAFSLKEHLNHFIEHRVFDCPILRRVVANSEMVKAHILKHFAFPADRIVVVRNGVDLARFSPANREKFRDAVRQEWKIGDELVLLFMANNFRLKGLHCLLRSLAVLKTKRRERVKALIVGKGHVHLEAAYAARLGLSSEVVFSGPTSEPEKFYAAADLFVHPTFYDPFANVCLEALASGLPVITTAFNGASELITNGGEGFVVDDPRNFELLAERMAYFLDPDARAAASQAARRLAEKHPAAANADHMIRIFQDVHAELRGAPKP